MNKELKKLTELAYMNKFDFELNEENHIREVERLAYILEQALTPPIADEIVKELNEYLKTDDFIHIWKYNSFFSSKLSIHIVGTIECDVKEFSVFYLEHQQNLFNGTWQRTNYLSLKLTDKITSFFMEEQQK